MDFKGIRPYVILVVLFLATIGAIVFAGRPSVTTEAPIRLELPALAGRWQGTDVFHCQSERCMASFIASELTNMSVCPQCGGPLDRLSLGEKKDLPKDTMLLRKQYRHPSGEDVLVSILVTGAERWSIHRPQWCIPSQGHIIERTRVIKIPLRSGESLALTLLDLKKDEDTHLGSVRCVTSAYAYWFVDKKHETPYHGERLFWMAIDNIFRGISQRWAFISIVTDRQEGSDEHIKKIRDFIAEFYPMIIAHGPDDLTM